MNERLLQLGCAALVALLSACAQPADDETSEGAGASTAASSNEDVPHALEQAFVGHRLELTQAISLERVGPRWFAEAGATLDKPLTLQNGAYRGVLCSIDGPASDAQGTSKSLPQGSAYRVAALSALGKTETASFELSLVNAAADGGAADFTVTCALFRDAADDPNLRFR